MFSYVVMSVRCLLVLVLATAALGKLRRRSELAEFARTLRVGLRLPRARLVAGAWVALEGGTALALVPPSTAGYAAILAAGEFGCLTVGAAVLVSQHRGFTCSCFGTSRSPLSWWTVLRNGALTAAGVLLAAGLWANSGAEATAAVLLAAVLTVLLGAVLVGQAAPLRALLEQSGAWRPAAEQLPRRSALSGGRR